MLYIFRNNNEIQIAWNSVVPRRQVSAPSRRLDTRFSWFGLIRTSSGG
jgi:hypothetical protein